MITAFQRNPYKWLMLFIVTLFLAGLFLPYETVQIVDFERENPLLGTRVAYGWQVISFQVECSISCLLLLVSLSSRIALRLLLMRVLLIVLILTGIVSFFTDLGFMSGMSYLPKLQIAGYFNYTGLLLTMLYGFLHFRKSYPVYKRLLEEQKKQSSDLLDSF